jgi:hypothetical protein
MGAKNHNVSAPKLFISYAWSNPQHEQWVLDLATQLRESGVDVILDKWDLKEGHDAVAFMEKMVTDSEINKVAMICDKTYAAKADGRAGGVGTETQIISKKVYEKEAQDKFVAIVTEKDENGTPLLPTYYKSRIYIDLSEPDRYGENFERLLRWVFDKPLYEKPELGAPPSFLSEGTHVSLGTTALFRRCIDAIKTNKAYAAGSFDEYCQVFASNLERFRLSDPKEPFDEAVIESIEEFLPYRNELIQLFTAIAQYSPTIEFVRRIHRLFESMIPYMFKSAQVSRWKEWDFDNFRFIIHELFLYALTVLLNHERFHEANVLLEQQYYMPGNADYGRDVMVSFVVFNQSMKSFEHRNERLRLRKLSLSAYLLKERCSGTGIEFRYIMQADFVAFMRAEIEAGHDRSLWWPETLIYLGHFHSPFEVFARSLSETYFDRVEVILAINTPADLSPLLKSYRDGSRRLPQWEANSFDPATLLGYEHLASRP